MWTASPDFPDYEVHPDGLVRHRRIKRVLKGWLHKTGKSPRGYLKITLGSGKNVLVHRMVLAAFVPPPSPAHQAAHKNHDTLDNRLENLHWRSHRENHDDSPDRVKVLTPDQARNLWALRASGLGAKAIAKLLGIKHSRVREIIKRDYYRDCK